MTLELGSGEDEPNSRPASMRRNFIAYPMVKARRSKDGGKARGR